MSVGVIEDYWNREIFAQVVDDACSAFWLARLTNITAMQDQPMVRIVLEFIRHDFEQFVFHLQHGRAGY